MRLRVIGLTLLFLCLIAPAVSYADDPIRVYINDEPLDAAYESLIIADRTYVPIRVIAEKWGAVVGWNQANQQVRIQKDRLIIDLFIGENEAVVNREPVYSDAAPVVVDGRTLIPLRFVGELLGAHVRYDAASHSVYVQLPSEQGKGSDQEEEKKPEEDQAEEPRHEDAAAVLKGITVLEDLVVVQLDGDTTLDDFYLKAPERIVLDFKHAVFDIQDETHQFNPDTYQFIVPSPGGLIEAVRYGLHDQDEPFTRVVIDLNTRGQYEIVSDEEQSQILIYVQPGVYKVVLDAGHGGHDPGAISYTGKSEKWFNLSVAKKIANLLEKEPRVQPYLTRATDDFVTLERRAEFANEIDADLFMSVHANAYKQSTRGTETYYYHSNSKQFGEIVHRHLVNATGFPDRKLQRARFYVLRNTDMPAVLIEAGFLTNPTEEKLLFQDDFQNKIAEAMADAIKEYLNLS